MKIYKCIKECSYATVGSYWAAKEGHYMFQRVESPSGTERTFIYLTPHILEKYFIELTERK